MTKKIFSFLFLILFLIPVCLTNSESIENTTPPSLLGETDQGEIESYWISTPSNGALIIVGVANRQTKQQDAITNALHDAAQKAAHYHGIKGKITRVLNQGSGFLDFYSDAVFELEYDTEYEKYLSALSFDPARDVFVEHDAVIVRCTYTGVNPGTVSYDHGHVEGKPRWVSKPPQEIAGYMAEVGFAKTQRRLKDTLAKSRESALASLIARLSTQVLTNDRDGTILYSNTLQISEGELVNFFVLETWIEPQTRSVWTLAVAKPKM
jgi:hypothetical protein